MWKVFIPLLDNLIFRKQFYLFFFLKFRLTKVLMYILIAIYSKQQTGILSKIKNKMRTTVFVTGSICEYFEELLYKLTENSYDVRRAAFHS